MVAAGKGVHAGRGPSRGDVRLGPPDGPSESGAATEAEAPLPHGRSCLGHALSGGRFASPWESRRTARSTALNL